MSAKCILSHISRGKLQGLHRDIEAYLKPALNHDETYLTDDQLVDHGIQAVKFLHGYVSQWDLVSSEDMPGVLEVMSMCYKCSDVGGVHKEPVHPQTILYNVVVKAVKRGFYAMAFPMITLLHTDLMNQQYRLKDSTDQCKKIEVLCKSVYATLWNSAIKSTEDSSLPPCTSHQVPHFTESSSWLACQRFQALSFLWLKERDSGMLLDQLQATLSRWKANVDTEPMKDIILSLIASGVHSLQLMIKTNNSASETEKDDILQAFSRFVTLVVKIKCHFLPHDISLSSSTFDIICQPLASLNIPATPWSMVNEVIRLVDRTMHLHHLINMDSASLTKQSSSSDETKRLAVMDVDERNKKLQCLITELTDGEKVMLRSIRDGPLSCNRLLSSLKLKSDADKTLIAGLRLGLHNTALACLIEDLPLVNSRTDNIELVSDSDTDGITVPLLIELTKKLSLLLQRIESGNEVQAAESSALVMSRECPDIISRCLTCVTKKRPHLTAHTADIASVFCNLGRLYLARDELKLAITFMKCASDILHQLLTSETPCDLRAKIWKRDEMLVDMLFKSGQSEEALQTIAACLLVNPTHVADAMEAWIRMKIKIGNSDPQSKLLARTLVEFCKVAVKQGAPRTTSLSVRSLLTGELTAWKKNQNRVKVACLSVVESLLGIQQTPADRASLLLFKVQVLWAESSPQSRITSLLEEALKLLRSAETDSDGSSKKPECLTVEDDLAQTLLWTYITSLPSTSQIKERLGQNTSCSATEAGASDLDAFTEECVTVAWMMERQGAVQEALAHWERMVASREGLGGRMRCVETSLHSAVTAAALCKLSHQMLEAQHFLHVAMAISKATNHTHYHLLAAKMMMEIFIHLKQPLAALSLADTLDEPLLPSDPTKKSFVACDFLLQKCKASLMADKVEDALSLHKKVAAFTASLGSKMKVKEGLVLSARIECLRYHMLGKLWSCDLADTSFDMSSLPSYENRLECVMQAVKDVSCVVTMMLGDWMTRTRSAKDTAVTKDVVNATDTWSRVDLLLEVLLHCGRAFVQVGDAREAECYLLQGVKLSQALLLPKRCGDFHLALAELYRCSEAWGRCGAHLERVHYSVLAYCNTNPPAKTGHLNASLKPSTTNTSQESDCFGFESSDGKEEEDYVLRVKPVVGGDVLSSDDEAQVPPNQTGASPSPVKRSKKLTWPRQWRHPADCHCLTCSDICLQRTLVKHLLIHAVMSVNTAHSEETGAVTAAVEFLKKMTTKLQDIEEATVKTVNLRSDEGEPCPQEERVYQDELLHMEMLRLEMSVCDGVDSPNRAADAEHLLTYCNIPEPYTRHAELAYLRAITTLSWPECTHDPAPEIVSSIQKLTEQIGNLNMNRSHVEDFKTPFCKRTKAVNRKKKVSEEDDSPLDLFPSDEVSPMEDITAAYHNIPELKAVAEPVTDATLKKSITFDKATDVQQSTKSDLARKSLVTTFKTPARKMRGGKKNAAAAANKDDLPLPAHTFKTPVSVASSRRLALDLLICSDDEEEENEGGMKKPKQKVATTTRQKRGTGTRGGRSTQTKKTSKLAVPVKENSSNSNVNIDTSPQPTGPVKSLFKSCPKDSEVTNLDCVYDLPMTPPNAPKRGRGVRKNNPSRVPKAGAVKRSSRLTRSDAVDARETSRGLSDDETSRSMGYLSDPERPADSESEDENCSLLNSGKKIASLKQKVKTKPLENSKKSSNKKMAGYVEIARAGSDDEDPKLVNLKSKLPTRRQQKSILSNSKAVKNSKASEVSSTAVPQKPKVKKPLQARNDNIPESGVECVKKKPRPTAAEASASKRDLVYSYKCLAYFPNVPTFRYTCQALAYLALNQSQAAGSELSDAVSQWETAFYLSEGQAITFRNNCVLFTRRKLRKLVKNSLAVEGSMKNSLAVEGSMKSAESDYKERLEAVVDRVKFAQTQDRFQEAVATIPADWTVCHVSVLSALGHKAKHMCITRYSASQPPHSLITPGYSTRQGEMCLVDFDDIMAEIKLTLQVTDKTEWWGRRQKLDTRLQELLGKMESDWLGVYHTMLMGRLTQSTDRRKLAEAVGKLATSLPGGATPQNIRVLELLLGRGNTWTDREILCLLLPLLPDTTDPPLINTMVTSIKQTAASLSSLHTAARSPVILILDKDIQHVPWESFPSFRQYAYTRVPSLYFLAAQISYLSSHPTSSLTHGLHPQSVFYILDPDSNLPETRNTFQSWFEGEKGWQGVTCKKPDRDTMVTAITQPDLFIYCGHGTGSKYLVGDSVACHQCRAVVLLMGCSSGRLSVEGRLEAHGVMLSYLLAGSPSVMGNLWDVTDRDIDRLFAHFLKSWLQSATGSSQSACLLDHLPSSRDVCKLPYLIGAAPVVYGLPVSIQQPADAQP